MATSFRVTSTELEMYDCEYELFPTNPISESTSELIKLRSAINHFYYQYVESRIADSVPV